MGVPSPKKPCPTCTGKMHPKANQCRKCNPAYQRTPEHNRLMSARTTGIRRPGWKPPSASREVAERIRASWTPEKRSAARVRGQKFARDPKWRLRCGLPGELNPMWEDGRATMPYARGWARKVKQLAWERAGHRCELCQSDKPRDTHHKDFRKDNHSLENLQVLCRKCHKGLHAIRAAQHRMNRRRHAHPQSTSHQG